MLDYFQTSNLPTRK